MTNMETHSAERNKNASGRPQTLVIAWAISIVALLAFSAAIVYATRSNLSWGTKSTFRAVSDAAELDSLVASLRASGNYPLLVDLRDGKDYEAGHAPGFLNVPNTREGEPFATWISPYRRDKPIVLICYGGNRSARAFEHLAVAGFTHIIDFTLGYEAYARQRGGLYSPESGSCDCPK